MTPIWIYTPLALAVFCGIDKAKGKPVNVFANFVASSAIYIAVWAFS